LVNHSRAARIILVSDDEQLRSLLYGLLVAHRYAGIVSVDSQSALAGDPPAEWDVAVVDVSGASLHTLRALRHLKTTSAAVVVIGAKKTGAATPHDGATGGDVLLAKPFDPRELLLIIRGMLDAGGDAQEPSRATVSVGPISLSPLLNSAIVASREIELTDVEARILRELLINATHPVTRERLTRRGLRRDWSPHDRGLDTHINRLRAKLGNDHRGRTPIRTVTGVGYLLLADWTPAA
jgi:two-component system response regulator CpxR